MDRFGAYARILLLAGMLGLAGAAGASFARRLATQKVKLRLQF